MSHLGMSARYQSGFVDDGLSLDMNRLLQRFEILPGRYVSGTLRWMTEDGLATIGYEASLLTARRAWLRLSYTIADPDRGKIDHHDYRIRLTTTRTHLGGIRWWFRCPATQLRTAKLYLPTVGSRFLSRRAYGGSRSRRRGLLVHLYDHFARDRECGSGRAARGTPPDPRARRIYAEWLGRPRLVGRARVLVPQASC
jgi:hypothetical protein